MALRRRDGADITVEREYVESEHPRDERGRWTEAGGGDNPPTVRIDLHGPVTSSEIDAYVGREMASQVAAQADRLSDEFNYPRGKVQYHNRPEPAQVGEVAIEAGMTADLQTGTINIYPPGVRGSAYEYNGDTGILTITAGSIDRHMFAHEVMHQKFHRVLEQYQTEERAGWKNDWMRPDGSPLDEHASKIPTYTALYPYIEWKGSGGDATKGRPLEEQDGNTTYSELWWDQWKKGQHLPRGWFSPVHETLAEISAGQSAGLLMASATTPLWTAFHQSVLREYGRLSKGSAQLPTVVPPGEKSMDTLPGSGADRDVAVWIDDEWNPVPQEQATWVIHVTTTGKMISRVVQPG